MSRRTTPLPRHHADGLSLLSAVSKAGSLREARALWDQSPCDRIDLRITLRREPHQVNPGRLRAILAMIADNPSLQGTAGELLRSEIGQLVEASGIDLDPLTPAADVKPIRLRAPRRR